MSLFKRKGQNVPIEHEDWGETPAVIEGVVKALESNKAAVHRWFWKGLLALNLVMLSVTVQALILLRFK